MRPTIVLNVVGLTPGMIGEATPNLSRLAAAGGMHPLRTILPAVTCPVQSTFLTGELPSRHGIVGNGWFFRDLSEIFFWRQSNHLVAGDKLWDAGRRRDPAFTCANMFWWYNMYSGADIGVTPRPMYPADGRKIPDCYANPGELRDELTRKFGRFPLFTFWGPATDISSSRWIADATKHVRRTRAPTVTLVYLPHLDYGLQRHGPAHPSIIKDLSDIDAVVGDLIADAERDGTAVIVVSEYGITEVSLPIHVNRALRKARLLAVREEMGREQLDPGASAAFAVSDHQVAHIYVNRKDRQDEVRALIAAMDGVETVLDWEGKAAAGLDHPRSGDLIAVARTDAWFTYYHWLDDDRAPDFARTVEIHRKPGFDPVELFLDPALRWPKLSVGWRLAKRALGFRSLLDVVPLDARLVKGSHGRPVDRPEMGPLLITSCPDLLAAGPVPATMIKQLILDHVFQT